MPDKREKWICTNCNTVVEMPAGNHPPVECPECDESTFFDKK